MAALRVEASRYGVHLVLPDLPPLAIWPENWAAVRLFDQMQSQWRTSHRGFVGLDYGTLPAGVGPGRGGRRGRRLFEALRVMEQEALAYLNR